MDIKFLSISADNGVTLEFRLDGKGEVQCRLPHSDTRYWNGDKTKEFLSKSLSEFIIMMDEVGKKDKAHQKEKKRATSNGKRPMLELE